MVRADRSLQRQYLRSHPSANQIVPRDEAYAYATHPSVEFLALKREATSFGQSDPEPLYWDPISAVALDSSFLDPTEEAVSDETYPVWGMVPTSDLTWKDSTEPRPAIANAVNMIKRGRHRYNCRKLMRADTGFGGIC
ncbi:uncharacterized protein LOC142335417 [Convolutriloba macropyga]|uniref:uncharacterized protein LOC142335417 n=1 Tax=Convolutriloba macropyga TaxID=536237 RepID=UPI003F52452A